MCNYFISWQNYKTYKWTKRERIPVETTSRTFWRWCPKNSVLSHSRDSNRVIAFSFLRLLDPFPLMDTGIPKLFSNLSCAKLSTDFRALVYRSCSVYVRFFFFLIFLVNSFLQLYANAYVDEKKRKRKKTEYTGHGAQTILLLWIARPGQKEIITLARVRAGVLQQLRPFHDIRFEPVSYGTVIYQLIDAICSAR